MFRGYYFLLFKPIRFLGQFLDNMIRPNKSNIDSLLEKPDCTIELLLADSDILTECKYGNQKVIN